MNSEKVFKNIKALSNELYNLTAESEANVNAIKNLCFQILNEIENLKEESVSAHVILTKNQATSYINQGLARIIIYNDKVTLRSVGNFTDIIKPIRAGLELLKNLNY
ncbi:hypothetical protein [Adhaeribacter aquaticus]|uniref:hypothetical protein n=1 Tax=Adhaeribacter aquaticus TaxID=299567 RepID=UPI0004788064|nr:hypothetical protein [Adhaeribacter aquaticus]